MCSTCSKLLFCSSCSTCCSTPLARPIVPLLLFNLLLKYLSITIMILLFFTPFVRCYYSCSSFFRLVFPPFYFFLQLSKFELFRLDLEGDNFFFQYLFVDDFFLIIHVFGKWCFLMCLFVVGRDYLNIVHSILRITFHFYTLHFICTIALCIFQHIASFPFSIACKCLG
jgi:hypothetical protein